MPCGMLSRNHYLQLKWFLTYWYELSFTTTIFWLLSNKISEDFCGSTFFLQRSNVQKRVLKHLLSEKNTSNNHNHYIIMQAHYSLQLTYKNVKEKAGGDIHSYYQRKVNKAKGFDK